MLKQRFVEILVNDNWEIRTYNAVKEGMIFRLYDVDGKMLETPNGSGELIALYDAEKTEDGYAIDFIYNEEIIS